MILKEGSTKIVNSMTTGAGILVKGTGHISRIVKMYYFLKDSLLPKIKQTNYIHVVMMNKEVSTKI